MCSNPDADAPCESKYVRSGDGESKFASIRDLVQKYICTLRSFFTCFVSCLKRLDTDSVLPIDFCERTRCLPLTRFKVEFSCTPNQFEA